MNQNEAHLRLLLPYDEALPPTLGGALPDIPAIWARARTFFARVIDHIGSIHAFSRRPVLKRDERTNLLDRLKPVERIVRAALVIRALAFLLMTPEGVKLRRDTQKLVWPPAPEAGARPEAESEAGDPGEAQLRRRAIADHPAAASALSIDCSAPAKRPSPFHVLRLRLPEEVAGEDKAEERDRGNGEAEEEAGVEEEPGHPGDEAQSRRRATPAVILARRIEALGRALADPDRLVPRLARFLARLPEDALEGLAGFLHPRPGWVHGHHDLVALRGHLICACRIYCRDPEPG
jgi:hypothetical protein